MLAKTSLCASFNHRWTCENYAVTKFDSNVYNENPYKQGCSTSFWLILSWLAASSVQSLNERWINTHEECMSYSALLSPINVGALRLPNRALWHHWPVCVVRICQMEQKILVVCQRHSWQPIIPSALAVVWSTAQATDISADAKATQVRPVFLVTHKLQAGKWLLRAYTKQAVILLCSDGTRASIAL